MSDLASCVVVSPAAPRIGLATAAVLPNLDDDGPILIDALTVAGLSARPAIWTDAAVDWGTFDRVLVRSTWDYASQRDRFLKWAEHVDGVSRLANPLTALRWNTDKRYLAELRDRGVGIVPTTFLEPGQTCDLPADRDFVVKPAISAGSRDTARYRADEQDRAMAHIARLHADGRVVMVQPYIAAVDDAGETALIFFGGEYSHGIRKGPILNGAVTVAHGLFAEEEISTREPSADERAAAQRVLAALPFDPVGLVYARVDLVPGADGEPLLLELELCEPSLFLQHSVDAAARLASALLAAS